MVTRICLLFFLLIVLTGPSVQAKTLPDGNAAQAFSAKVMHTVGQGKITEALLMMKPYMIIPEAEFDVMKDQLATQAPMIKKRFGKSIGSEFIKVDKVGKSLMRVLYIQKFEKHIMRWVFYFYRPGEGWILNTFTTDDSIKQLFCK